MNEIYETLDEAEHLNLFISKGYSWLLFKGPIQDGTFGTIPTFHPHFIFIETEPVIDVPEISNPDWYALPLTGAGIKDQLKDDVYWYVVNKHFLEA